MTWKGIVAHSIRLEPERSEQNFFHHVPGRAAAAVGDQTEEQVIDLIFCDQDRLDLFMGELGISGHNRLARRADKPITDRNVKPGDIDILISPKDAFHLSTAVEVKRIKVVAQDQDTDNVTKLYASIKKGATQANALLNMGFHRAFLCIVVQIDVRERATANTILKPMTQEVGELLTTLIRESRADPELGLILVRMEQPSDFPISERMNFFVKLARPAQPRDQTRQLTEKITEYYRFHDSK